MSHLWYYCCMAKITPQFTEQTRKFLNVALVLLAGLAIAAGFLMKDTGYTLVHGYMVRDQIMSQLANTSVFAPAVRNIAELPIKWLLITTLATAALLTTLKLTRFRARYENELKNGISTLRWIETAIVGSLLITIVAFLSGITDILVIALLAGFVVLSAVFNWLSERHNKGARKADLVAHKLAVATGIIPMVYILIVAVMTLIYGMIRAPWYVYVLYLITFTGSWLLLRNRRKQLLAADKVWKDNAYVDKRHAMISTVTLILFSVVLIVGLLKSPVF